MAMPMEVAVASSDRPKAYRAILWAGLIAGTLDITAASINGILRGGNPMRVLRSVASGLLGADALEGGVGTAALGLVLHFLIAFGASTVFFVASRKMRFLVRYAVVCGLLYGVAVYAFMNSVVVPLSAAPFEIPYRPIGLIIHMLCVGLPIALVVRRFSE